MSSTYIIADIHGHLTPLQAILNAINPTANDTLITLGDYIDRGPDSKRVLDTLLSLQSQTNLISLLGNHEEMMLNSKTELLSASKSGVPGDPRVITEWLMNGGDKALESYDAPACRAGNSSRAFNAIPKAHWDFLNTCRSYYETDTHLFVHACINPYLPLDQQDEHTLRWERFDDPAPHVSGKILVCGHTPQRSGLPRNIGHAICLDTGVHVNRNLTCLQLPQNTIIQSNPTGKIHKSPLSDYLVPPNPSH